MKKYVVIFGALGFLAVSLGAFGAHALRDILDDHHKAIFETANRYHFYHVFALGFVLFLKESLWAKRAAFLFSLGMIVFSGSLYALAITKIKILGAITPIGGVMFLIAWIFAGLGFKFHLAAKSSDEQI